MKQKTEPCLLCDIPGGLDRLPQYPPREVDITKRDNEGRWLSGQSAHPQGRPLVAHCISDQLRLILNMSMEEIKAFKPATGAQVIALRMYLDRDPQVLRELLNRAEGKVRDTVDLQTTATSIIYELAKPKEDKNGYERTGEVTDVEDA